MARSRLARVLIAALLAPLIAACAGPAPEQARKSEADIDLTAPVEVQFWFALSGAQQKAMLEFVDEFNRTNQMKITVKAENQQGYTQLYQKNLAAIQAGTVPDTAVAYESFVADYMKADIVVNLDPYLSSKHGLSKQSQDDIYKPYFETNRFAQFGNQLLSFPFTKSLDVMYQNDDLLKEVGAAPPKTWDDFEKAAKAAFKKGADGKVTRWGWAVPASASTFNAWVYARGGKLMSDDAKTVAWDGKEGLEALKLVERGFKEGWAYQPKGFDWQNDFGAGRLAFVMSSTSSRPFIRAALAQPINWSLASLPQTDPSKPKTVQYGANITVFKSTPEKQLAAWEFIKWFTLKEQTTRWATASFYMPVRRSAADDPALQEWWKTKDPQGKQAFDLIATSAPEPNVRGQQDIRTVIEDMLVRVMTGKATAEVALKEAGTKANQILKENQ